MAPSISNLPKSAILDDDMDFEPAVKSEAQELSDGTLVFILKPKNINSLNERAFHCFSLLWLHLLQTPQ